MQNNILGDRIKELLRKNNLTPKELARKVGITDISMTWIISGERMPHKLILWNIATVLHATTDYLLGNENYY